jgi:tetratricopeptide (TPR) repeat protein
VNEGKRRRRELKRRRRELKRRQQRGNEVSFWAILAFALGLMGVVAFSVRWAIVAILLSTIAYLAIREYRQQGWSNQLIVGLCIVAILASLSVVYRTEISCALESKELRSEEGYFERATKLSKSGKHELALVDLRKALCINPESQRILHNRALIYTRLGEYESAIEDLDRVIDINNDFADAWFARGRIYLRRSGEGDLAKSVSDFSRCVYIYGRRTNDKGVDKCFHNRGLAYLGKGELQSAVTDLRTAISKAEFAGFYLDLGCAYYRLGELPKSRAYFKEAARRPARQEAIKEQAEENLADIADGKPPRFCFPQEVQ